MKKIQKDELTVFISDEMAKDFEEAGKMSRDLILEQVRIFLSNDFFHLFKKYFQLFEKLTGLVGNSVLFAHGGASENNWTFYDGRDGEKEKKVESWVKEQDGASGILTLCVCNPEHCTVIPEKSLLVLPDNSFNGLSLKNGEAHLSLISPKEEITGYILEYETELLKKQLKLNTTP